jgi:hypothetical protein
MAGSKSQDTVAKRLMMSDKTLIIPNDLRATGRNLNEAIFKKASSESFLRKWQRWASTC